MEVARNPNANTNGNASDPTQYAASGAAITVSKPAKVAGRCKTNDRKNNEHHCCGTPHDRADKHGEKCKRRTHCGRHIATSSTAWSARTRATHGLCTRTAWHSSGDVTRWITSEISCRVARTTALVGGIGSDRETLGTSRGLTGLLERCPDIGVVIVDSG